MKEESSRRAIMKRANIINTIQKVRFRKENNEDARNKDLRDNLEWHAKEVIAQIGRASSYSMDESDLRVNGALQGEYIEKANQLSVREFNKNAKKALGYESLKDSMSKKKRFWYNVYRKSINLLNAIINKIRPDDKPLFRPGQKVVIGVVAAILIAPPLGLILGVFMLLKAAKEKFYDGSRLQKVFHKAPKEPYEKLNRTELDKVTFRELIEEEEPQMVPTDQRNVVKHNRTLNRTELDKVTSEELIKEVEPQGVPADQKIRTQEGGSINQRNVVKHSRTHSMGFVKETMIKDENKHSSNVSNKKSKHNRSASLG
jgi:hypothetical protein